MKVDGGLMITDLASVPEHARKLEKAGYDGAISAEISSDPFLPLTLAAEHTERIDLMTSIAVAFSRSPMTLANIGHDLNAFSKGRFILGLGSQIRPHIVKRFSMPWSHPAARMREFIQAMRTIWDCWYDGKQLDFRGEFYSHTLMTPMFTPQNTDHGPPRVFLAAVGPRMTEVAGEVADGLIAHAFTTEKYMREVTIPAIERGLATAGRSRDSFAISCPMFVVTGHDEESFQNNRAGVCKQIAFYGSTPAYRGVLETHGWGDLQTELNRLSKAGQWDEMGTLIEEDMLDAFAVVAEPGDIASKIGARYGDLVDRVMGNFGLPPEQQRDQLAALKAI
jgi:probable F420-dependent oxidoreductase